MYIGTHYNGYYNNLFGDRGSIYSSFSKTKATNAYLNGSNNFHNSASLQYVQDLKAGSSQLNSAAHALSSNTSYSQKTAVSSNNSLMTVKSTGSYSPSSKPLSVRINQIATGQTNTGAAMAANAKSSLSGYQQFSIETNGRSYQFSINVGAGDSNKDMQQKMAAAINMRNIGINASVVTDSKTGLSTLSIAAQNTGENNKSTFKIQDVHGSAVQQTGTDQVSQKAQNAVYTVNGGEKRESQSNTVNLGNGITATLLAASDEEITVTKDTDTSYVADMVQDFIDGYNKLYGAALNNTSDSKSNSLFSQLVDTSRTYSSSLSKIGISFDSNGYMQADSEKVAQAAQDGSLQNFFAGTANYGYTNKMSKIANSVSNNTGRYVSQTNLSNDLQSSLFNFYDNNFFNSYQNYMNTNNRFNSGLLFDLLL